MENKELEAINVSQYQLYNENICSFKQERRGLWSTSKITLSASLQQPNKLYGNINIEPASSKDFIDHFELYVNDVALKKTIAPRDVQFSIEGFAGGEQYEIYVVAYPTDDLIDAEPISSNKCVKFFYIFY